MEFLLHARGCRPGKLARLVLFEWDSDSVVKAAGWGRQGSQQLSLANNEQLVAISGFWCFTAVAAILILRDICKAGVISRGEWFQSTRRAGLPELTLCFR
jgi:hypothetical protein